MTAQTSESNPLRAWQPQHDFFIGIDSDGCVFDSMEIKHKECFCPNTIKHWNLQPVSKYAREAAEFVNLYSKWRGANRWPALITALDLLRGRPEVLARQADVPQANKVREFIASGFPLSEKGLLQYKEQHPHPELDQAQAWSLGVNQSIADIVHGVPPFPQVRESLQKMAPVADMMVVSATPIEALEREWQEHELAQYMGLIAGQEAGTKEQHLALAARGKYAPQRILMIGDALGDLKAAQANCALFYPINPGCEIESWQRFLSEASDKFLNGTYAGAYEASLIADFENLLPDTPTW
ncbi:MAG: haloacid dehalogenase [Chloroflexi bacterium HGW-Chloroflexi-6]|nr:MAG: haloacid dehalogenase [Chloroflexi bacterium HGW-Chloroflexi-6]